MTARAYAGEDFYAFQSFNRDSECTKGVFGPAEFDFEICFSVRSSVHAQRTILAQINAFNANRRVPSGFLESRNSILLSILVYDATRMRRGRFSTIGGYLAGFSFLKSILVYDTTRMPRGRFSRKSKPLTQIGAYLGGFWTR